MNTMKESTKLHSGEQEELIKICLLRVCKSKTERKLLWECIAKALLHVFAH